MLFNRRMLVVLLGHPIVLSTPRDEGAWWNQWIFSNLILIVFIFGYNLLILVQILNIVLDRISFIFHHPIWNCHLFAQCVLGNVILKLFICHYILIWVLTTLLDIESAWVYHVFGCHVWNWLYSGVNKAILSYGPRLEPFVHKPWWHLLWRDHTLVMCVLAGWPLLCCVLSIIGLLRTCSTLHLVASKLRRIQFPWLFKELLYQQALILVRGASQDGIFFLVNDIVQTL